MRLATKLLASLALTTLVVLGMSSVLDHRRRNDLVEMDRDYEIRTAHALRHLTTALCETAGPEAAQKMIETANPHLPRDWAWITLDQVPTVPERDVRGEIMAATTTGDPVFVVRRDGDAEGVRSGYIAIPAYGKLVGVISVSHSLAPHAAFHRRGQMQTAGMGFAVLLLAATLAAVLGQWMVTRPLGVITSGVRALGEGRFDAVPTVARRDELGALATELRTLGTRLAERERLRHEDRLRTIGQLASGVAHELGTPLSVVAVRAKLIASGEVTGDEARGSAAAIAEQAQRMTGLVRQLLDYARRKGTPADVDVQAAVRKVADLLEPMARQRNVTMTVHDAATPVVVRAEPAQIEQVVVNLMMNGIQAMPEGGRLDITVGSGPLTPPPDHGGRPRDYAWVTVRDEGVGIASENRARIFEPFFTTKAMGVGTGLGLPVAQAIVTEHGGWIDVASEPGRGAAFTVALPPAAEAGSTRIAS